MSMISFGDLAQSNLLRQHTAQAKSNITRLSQELTTGRTSDTSRHVSGDLGPLLAIDNSLAQLAGYGAITQEMGLFAGAMQSGLQVISSLALDAGTGLITASGTAGAAQIDAAASAAHGALKSMMGTLNTRFGDRTLFAGAATAGPAVADTQTLLTELETVTASATTLQDLETALDGWFASPTGYATTIYQGGPPLSAVPIAPDETAQLDITADDPALRATIKGLAMAALLDRGLFSGNQALRTAVAQRAGESLIATETDRAYLAARLGSTEAQIETAQTRNAAQSSGLQMARVGITEVDPYETATRLQDAETQLQLIYTLTARISRLNLADYL